MAVNINLLTTNLVVEALIERGYNPYAQLNGYLIKNNDRYITSHQNARKLIKTVDREFLDEYLREWDFYQDKEWKTEFINAIKEHNS